MDELTVEQACEVMHDAYEKAAAANGWETQAKSRVPWSEVPEANKATMRVAVAALLAAQGSDLAAKVTALADEIEASQRGPHDNLIGLRWTVDRLRALADPADTGDGSGT